MDVEVFLSLPIDIRRQVYFHLDGYFCKTAPAPVQELYSNVSVQLKSENERITKKQKLLYKRYHELFSPFLNIFEYAPSLYGQWLEYSLWLRYDAIVLDCLRVNLAYGGSLIGHLNWVCLDNRPRLAYFKNCLLMVWYTLGEYARWIVKEEASDEETDSLHFFTLSLEYLDLKAVKLLLNSMKCNDYLILLSEVFFDPDEEDDVITKDELEADEVTYPMDDLKGIEVIKNMEDMKNINKISVRGATLFEALINFHGVRDNPGKTINYMVKKRIMRLDLWQLVNPTKSGIADFTRWENLRDLRLIKIESVDLNRFVLPEQCQVLVLRQITVLKWWNFGKRIVELIGGKSKVTQLNSFTTLRSLDQRAMAPDEIMQCRAIVWLVFKHLNLLRLQDVIEVSNGTIVVPNALYQNARIQIFPTTSAIDEIITV